MWLYSPLGEGAVRNGVCGRHPREGSEMNEDELMDRLAEMLEEWQVDALVEIIRREPEWVAVGRDPMLGMLGEAPEEWTWNLN